MDAKVNIFNKQRKVTLTKDIKQLIKKSCLAVLQYEKFLDDAEIDVTLVSDKKIKQVNTEFRGIENSTDVLSFPLGENGVYDENPETNAKMLGDIMISAEHAIYQADLYGHSLEREIAFLTVHSMLHLLGYDHVNNEQERKLMRKKEEEILEVLGLKK